MSQTLLLRKYFFAFVCFLVVIASNNAHALGRVQTEPNQGESLISLEEANQRCEVVLAIFNLDKLEGQINVIELTGIVRSLRDQGKLPAKFLTKNQARDLGWQPGRAFNTIDDLRGRALGGDHFGNYEKRLPQGKYFEADLDYLGLKRNAKRLVYEDHESMYVTIDHYDSFEQVPTCH
ncbi:MAG: ribonuclease domain-containing protein [Alcaligenaceae bacterium]|nr:ribonuclease domain-containing protein [Alcaligenaceae bacterium]